MYIKRNKQSQISIILYQRRCQDKLSTSSIFGKVKKKKKVKTFYISFFASLTLAESLKKKRERKKIWSQTN